MDIILFVVTSLALAVDFTNCDCNDGKCHVTKVLGMKAADCYDSDVRQFPQCLPTSIEIIDLTKNRIKQLRKSDLDRYSSLKMLYLQDNFLLKIEENTFDGKTDLTTLDLSNNGMARIPLEIFYLPSLQSLYLSQNTNTNIVEIVESAKPITSPLTQFDISFSDIERLPAIGTVPTLVKYNISGNNLYHLRVKYFSGLCGLKYLITTNVTVALEDPCECWHVNRWLKTKNVIFTPFDCELKDSLCVEMPFNNTDVETYEMCSKELKEIVRKSMLKKFFIPGALALAVLLICLGIFFRRRKKANRKIPRVVPLEEEKLAK